MTPDQGPAQLSQDAFVAISRKLMTLPIEQDSALPSFIRSAGYNILETEIGLKSFVDDRHLLMATYLAAQGLAFNFQNFQSTALLQPVSDVSFGFIYIGTLPPPEDITWFYRSWCFGVALVCDQKMEAQPIQLVGTLSAFGADFPVYALAGPVEMHSLPDVTAPKSGSCAAWVTPRPANPKAWSSGLITARHVVEPDFNQVSLATRTGAIWTSTVEHAKCTIDSVVLDAAGLSRPAGLVLASVPGGLSAPLAPGCQIELQGQHTKMPGSVLRIHQDTSYLGYLFGQRIIIDASGIPGDSGGVVRLVPGSDPAGVYLGSFSFGSGRHGVAQTLYQVIEFFDLEAYK